MFWPRRVLISISLVMASLAIALLTVGCGSSSDQPTAAAVSNGAEVPSGRAALIAAEGDPHVLWFWGAH